MPDVQPLDSLQWTVWPARQRPLLTVLLLGFCLMLSYVATDFMRGVWWGFITLVVLAVSLAEYWFPTRYTLTATHVCVRRPGRRLERPWEAFRLAVALSDCLVLSPLTNLSSWVARRRSVTLLFDNNEDQVRDFVGRRVELRDQS